MDGKVLRLQCGLTGETRNRKDTWEGAMDGDTFEDANGIASSRGESNVKARRRELEAARLVACECESEPEYPKDGKDVLSGNGEAKTRMKTVHDLLSSLLSQCR